MASGPSTGHRTTGTFANARRGSDFIDGRGFSMYVTQHQPTVNGNGYSRAALTMQQMVSADDGYSGGSNLEIGWVVEPNVWGTSTPRLFVSSTDKGTFKGFVNNPVASDPRNTAWVQYSSTVYPGMPVTPAVAVDDFQHFLYEARLYNGNWWIYYGSTPVGYVPNANWVGGLSVNSVLAGGSALQDASPICTDIGSARNPNALPDSSYHAVSNISSVSILPWSVYAYQRMSLPYTYQTPGYGVKSNPFIGPSSTDIFAFGGPGNC